LGNGLLLLNSAVLNDLEAIRSFTNDQIKSLDISELDTYDILLATTEAVTNILLHGYQNQPGWIEIEIRTQDNLVTILIRDKAPSFDPTQVPPPALEIPLEERPLGRMGVYLIKQCMDKMLHRDLPTGGNELTLVKKYVSNYV